MPRLTAKSLRERYRSLAARERTKPKTIKIVHALKSRAILRDPLDQRTRIGKLHRERVAALTSDLGGDLSVAQSILVDQASRLHLLAQLAWNHLTRVGLFNKRGDAVPAYEAYLRTISREADVLRLLGLERRSKPVPDLQSYLAARATDGDPSD